jgi:trans-aconitate methyltransferase
MMKTHQRVRCFDSSSVDYHKAFQVFLDHTDQKAKAQERLDQLVAELPSRRTLIDAGAGNGKVTSRLTGFFEKTIASEPNASLRTELAEACPKAEILGETILGVKIAQKGDFVLASHVFYYIDPAEWLANLERLASWLAPRGILTIILQNHESDCMDMLRHFVQKSFDLNPLANEFKRKSAGKYDTRIHTIPSYVTTPDADSAYIVAEFMMNLVPLKNPPTSDDLRQYVEKNFETDGSGYRFSCTQDFLEIRGV